MSKASRTRAPNFSKQEQLLLGDAVKEYSHIIEGKTTDAVKQTDKQDAWEKIAKTFNAHTTGQPRGVENLISCYRNLKSKIKKQHADAKMLIVDPAQRGALIRAIEENGKDWRNVASTASAVSIGWQDPQVCEKGFEELSKEIQRNEKNNKKMLVGTGGGPHQPEKDDSDLAELKKLIEPQIDGLFTIYDNDAELMSQYQQTLPETQRTLPIEENLLECTKNSQDKVDIILEEVSHQEDNIFITPNKKQSRTEILRKKKDPALSRNEITKKTTRVNDSFKVLAEAKYELVRMQKLLIEKELLHKEKLQELELEDKLKEYKFKEKMREKELVLMDIKIQNVQK